MEIAPPSLPSIRTLQDVVGLPQNELRQIGELARPYIAHFHNYLVHGGFPQIALMKSIVQAQKLLCEDVVDKIIKRDMTASFGVRGILDLEQTFLYLCFHDGGILDMSALCGNLQVTRPTAQRFVHLLEAAHLIFRLAPFGYGREVLRGRYKIYLADASIPPAVMLKGDSFIEEPQALEVATEAAVLKHLFAHYYNQGARFSYWRGRNNIEVDMIAEVAGQVIPFEVKYRSRPAEVRSLKGLVSFCREKDAECGYVVTKSLDDLGLLQLRKSPPIFRIPATLFCYWIGEMESGTRTESS